MTRTRLVWDDRKGISGMPAEEYYAKYGAPKSRLQISLGAVREPFKSPVDGTVISSKSERDAHMKKHGLAMDSDFKNQKPPDRKPSKKQIERDFADAAQMVNQGYKPPPSENFDPNEFE